MQKVVALVLVGVFSNVVLAAKGTASRGGLGFLFSDGNGFANPAHFGSSEGTASEINYAKTGGSTAQDVTVSAVHGNGRMGFGAYFERAGTDIATTDVLDIAGVGVGVSLLKDALNLGVGYGKSVSASQTNNGAYNVALTWVPKGKGISAGVGAVITIGGSTTVQSATVSLGYVFSPAVAWEVAMLSSDWTTNGLINGNPATYLKTEGGRFYGSFGYVYLRSASQHSVSTRLGMMMGQKVDLSLYGSAVAVTGGLTSFGATARVVF